LVVPALRDRLRAAQSEDRRATSLGWTHGYGIAKRIEQISADMLAVNHGTPLTTR